MIRKKSMNWYKKAQEIRPIAITSYFDSIGELGISFSGGKTYIYPDVSPFLYEKINILLRVKNYREVSKILRRISENSKKNEEKEREEILNDLYNRGILK